MILTSPPESQGFKDSSEARQLLASGGAWWCWGRHHTLKKVTPGDSGHRVRSKLSWYASCWYATSSVEWNSQFLPQQGFLSMLINWMLVGWCSETHWHVEEKVLLTADWWKASLASCSGRLLNRSNCPGISPCMGPHSVLNIMERHVVWTHLTEEALGDLEYFSVWSFAF